MNIKTDEKIPVCCACKKICKVGEYQTILLDMGEYAESYVSNCCNSEIIYFDNIREVILFRLSI